MAEEIIFNIFMFISYIGGFFIGLAIIHSIIKVVIILIYELIKFVIEQIIKWVKKIWKKK